MHIQLDEAETRQLIDQQLLQAGWQADFSQYSFLKRYAPGTWEKLSDCRMAYSARLSGLCPVCGTDFGGSGRSETEKYRRIRCAATGKTVQPVDLRASTV